MKSILAAAAAVSLLAVPGLALADGDTEFSGNIGVSNMVSGDLNFQSVEARLGYRFNKWLGVEIQGQIGVTEDTVTVNVPPPTDVDVKLDSEISAYLVASVPLSETGNVRLIARVGYGTQTFSASAGGTGAAGDDTSVNFGVGARWLWDGRNGLQLDYTRHEFQDGGDADVFALTYVRVFN